MITFLVHLVWNQKATRRTEQSKKHLENIEFEITNDVEIAFVDEGFILVKNVYIKLGQKLSNYLF